LDDSVIKLTVDNKEIEAKEGTNLLQVCLENDIYIPNLCYLEDMKQPPASCRLCFVEMDGENKPVASCTLQVKAGMVIRTDSPSVRKLQRAALQLLLSAHHVDCGPCPANKKCDLQHMAKFLKVGLKPRHLEKAITTSEREEDHPCLVFYPDRCVLCGKCVYVCRMRQEKPHLTFAKRGLNTTITFYGETNLATLPCETCNACVEICPVSAITMSEGLKAGRL
jgi:NADH dehydrogenase/NADH:ubiquinone oxidoreductase subunit G